MLQLAWFTNSYEGEINAFDHIAFQYFYLGDLEKAQYHKRSIHGIREKEDSYAKRISIEKFNKEIELIEKETGYVKEMDQIVDSTSKNIIKIMNDLPCYENVSTHLKATEKTVNSLLKIPKSKMDFYHIASHKSGFDQSVSMNDTEETFIQLLRKGFVRYVREGTQMIELAPTEIPSPRNTVPPEPEPFELFRPVEGEEQPGILMKSLHKQLDSLTDRIDNLSD